MYEVGTAYSGTMFIPNFVKIGELVETLKDGTRRDSMVIPQAHFISETKKFLL
jgi:hypothetical protein